MIWYFNLTFFNGLHLKFQISAPRHLLNIYGDTANCDKGWGCDDNKLPFSIE